VPECNVLLTRRAGAPVSNISENPTAEIRIVIGACRLMPDRSGTFLGFRFIFIACAAVAGYHFRPFSLSERIGALAGFLVALGVILFEVRLRRARPAEANRRRYGIDSRILGAYLTSLILSHTIMPDSTRSFFGLSIFLGDDLYRLVLGRIRETCSTCRLSGGLFASERTPNIPSSCSIPAVIDGRWQTSPMPCFLMAR